MNALMSSIATLLLLQGAIGTAIAQPKEVPAELYLEMIAAGISPPKILPDTPQRIGVFEFEDPDSTGLSVAASKLFAREILATASASRIGVIFFRGDLSASTGTGPSYFDLVETLALDQDIILVVWGTISRTPDGVQIDSYLQIPEQSLDAYFKWQFVLPQAMGGGTLVARLRPDRFLLNRVVLDEQNDEELTAAAKAMDQLRESRDLSVEPDSELLPGEVYYVHDNQEDWLYLVQKGAEGWVPRVLCRNQCQRLQVAANFGGQVLQYVANNRVPEITDELSPGSKAFVTQLAMLEDLKRYWSSLGRTARNTEDWLASNYVPPGGASLANVQVMTDLMVLINDYLSPYAQSGDPDIVDEEFDRFRLGDDYIWPLVDRLVEASQYDPRNTDVLCNLSVLFNVVEEQDRASLALELAREYSGDEDVCSVSPDGVEQAIVN